MSTLASSFTYTGFSISTPVGTIVSYLGINDPNGWIICDGVQRTGGAGRYKELCPILNAAMGNTSNNGGAHTEHSVTPPDLRSRVLYGKANTTTTISGTGGSSTATLTIEQMPSHDHTITFENTSHKHENTLIQTDHTHLNTLTNGTHSHSLRDIYEVYNVDSSVAGNTGGDGNSSGGQANTHAATVSINNFGAQAIITYNNVDATIPITGNIRHTGGDQSFAILPPYFTVNYIIKY